MKEAFIILFIHWLADFVLQTDKQAKGKSKSLYYLLSHTVSYSCIWFAFGLLYFVATGNTEIKPIFHFVVFTFIAHTITDFFTSRLNSHLWQKGKTHEFFVSIGFDQLLHYAQLFICYTYLIK